MSDFKKQQEAFVDALEKCSKLATTEGRDDCIGRLPEDIQNSIDRRSDLKSGILKMVERCSDFPGGIAALEEAVAYFETSPSKMDPVRKCAEILIEAIEAARISPPPPKPSGGATVPQLEGAYALVIGVSNYDPPPPPGPAGAGQPTSNRFPNLRFADKDAEDFYKFLHDNKCIGPEPLLNEKATLRGIMHALDDLWKDCAKSRNPLVLVFFSGHGAPDGHGRHYLVPHDGVRDDLFATALWSITFDNALRQLNKEKQLVVFLDACHAGGMEVEGAKGVLSCDPETLLPEQEGRCRYVVASCSADKVSREADGHGIFSKELLTLLRCKEEEDFEAEEIELFRLCNTLKQRVLKATNNYQEPWANVKKRTGIVLAINSARKQARVQRQERLLDEVDKELAGRERDMGEEMPVRVEIWTALRRHIDSGSESNAPSRFYSYCRAAATRLADVLMREHAIPPDVISKICDNLIGHYGGGDFTPSIGNKLGIRGLCATFTEDKATTPPSAMAAEPTAPNQPPPERDRYAPSDPIEKTSPEGMGASRASPAILRQQPERRQLSKEVSDEVMASILKPVYYREAGDLQELLNRPDGVSEEEVTKWLMATRPKDPRAKKESWDAVCSDIATRFAEQWRYAKTIRPQNALSVRTGGADA